MKPGWKFRTVARFAIGTSLLVAAETRGAAQAECSEGGANAAAAATPPIDPATSLRSRVRPPSESVLQTYRDAGAQDVAGHKLTDDEWAAVDAALTSLPALHKEVLKHHLRHISFVDATTSLGTALTSTVETCGGPAQFDITLRSTLFFEDLTTFLNRKEQGLFEADLSGYQVHIEAGNMSAMPYILLHEATHFVDNSLGVSARSPNPLKDGIWGSGRRDLAAPHDSNPISGILWRGGKKVPLGAAADLYRGLGASPFVSLYAATAINEDFAETVAWQQLSAQAGIKLRIEVRDRHGERIYELEPLKSPLVRARLTTVEELLAGARVAFPAASSPATNRR